MAAFNQVLHLNWTQQPHGQSGLLKMPANHPPAEYSKSLPNPTDTNQFRPSPAC